jgi:hypothetical protein
VTYKPLLTRCLRDSRRTRGVYQYQLLDLITLKVHAMYGKTTSFNKILIIASRDAATNCCSEPFLFSFYFFRSFLFPSNVNAHLSSAFARTSQASLRFFGLAFHMDVIDWEYRALTWFSDIEYMPI